MRCATCGRRALPNLWQRRKLRRKLRWKEELEESVNKPVLGLLPRIARRHHVDGVVTLQSPNSWAAEAYRALRSSLQYMAIDRPMTCVQVTSATSGEGKTTVATNLAASFAKAKQRVIILDCDLRRPKVHDAFGLPNEKGFTSVLLDQCPLTDAITTVENEPFLAVLPAGPVPPNPNELLSSDRAKAILVTLREHCDILLIDTPPIIPVADAQVVSSYVDVTLLVARTKLTTKGQIMRADELLKQAKAPLVGTVLNGVVDKSGDGYGYGYTGYEGGGGGAPPPRPPRDGGGPPLPPGGGQPPSEGGGPTSGDRARRKPPGPPDKSGHIAKSAPEPEPQTTGRTSPGPTGTKSRRVKAGTR